MEQLLSELKITLPYANLAGVILLVLWFFKAVTPFDVLPFWKKYKVVFTLAIVFLIQFAIRLTMAFLGEDIKTWQLFLDALVFVIWSVNYKLDRKIYFRDLNPTEDETKA